MLILSKIQLIRLRSKFRHSRAVFPGRSDCAEKNTRVNSESERYKPRHRNGVGRPHTVRSDRGVLRTQRAGSHQAHAARNEAVFFPNVARARHGAKNKTREATGIQGRHLSLRHSKNALITSAPLLGIALLLHFSPYSINTRFPVPSLNISVFGQFSDLTVILS